MPTISCGSVDCTFNSKAGCCAAQIEVNEKQICQTYEEDDEEDDD